MPGEVFDAYTDIKNAAEKFPDGSPEKEVARHIVARLAKKTYAMWDPNDMELLDSCLVEDSAACQEFMDAMQKLREIHEGSLAF